MKQSLFITILLYVISSHAFTQVAKNRPVNNIDFTTIDGFSMNSKMFENKHLIVTTFNISNINRSVLMVLDSIERKYFKSVVVIGIPLADSASKTSKTELLTVIRDSLHLSFPIMQVVTSKSGQAQNLLLRLANDSSASHFRVNKNSIDQTWMLDSSGVPYSYFNENQLLSCSLLEKLLLGAEKRDDQDKNKFSFIQLTNP